MASITASMVKELREITGVAMMDCKKALVETDGNLDGAKEYLQKKGQAKALKKSARETSEGSIKLHIQDNGKKGAIVKVACETDFVARNDKFQNLLTKLATIGSNTNDENFLDQSDGKGGTIQDLITTSIASIGENIQIANIKSLSVNEGIIGGYIHTNGKIGVLVELVTETACDDPQLNELAKDIAMHIAASNAKAVNPDEIDPSVIEKEKEIQTAQAKDTGKPDNIIEKMINGRIQKYIKEICVNSQPFVKNPEVTIGKLVNQFSEQIGTKIELKRFVKFDF